LIYQKDFEPGLAVRGDEDIIDMNYIQYLEVDTFELSSTSTSIDNSYLDLKFSIYPNPANNILTLDYTSKNNDKSVLSITNIVGEKIKEFQINTVSGINTLNLNLEGINNGVYFINFINNSSKSTKKFVISR
jgi:hypothetical protein